MAKRRSHEDFVKEVNEKNPHIEIISQFQKVKEKVKWHCNKHDTFGESRADVLLKGNCICEKCVKEFISNNENIKQACRDRAKTHEQFIEEIKNINPNIEILSKYSTNHVKVKCKCLVCGNEFSMTPHNLLAGQNCPKCSRIKTTMANTKTHKQFVKEVEELNPNIKILSEYSNSREKVKCKCNIDGFEWESTADNILRGHGCPICAIENTKGENNSRWNHSLTDEERTKKRNYPEYRKWRESVFQRDNYMCRVTGKSGYLIAHHIYSFDRHPNLRTDVENGITVCKEIHDLFHSIYGKGNNTKEQWNEFVNNYKNDLI